MFHNYYFLKRLATALNDQLSNYSLYECFSQNKEELILGFGSPKGDLYIRANLHPQIALLHIGDGFARARKNSVDLFAELIGKKVNHVRIFNFERSFNIQFEGNYSLIFKMHGSRSNIILSQNQELVSLFRNNIIPDQSLNISELDKNPDLSFAYFKEIDGELRKFNPALGAEITNYLAEEGYQEANLDHKWSILQAVLSIVEQSPIRILDQDPPLLSLLPSETESAFETNDPIIACTEYYTRFTKYFYLNQTRNQLIKPLEADIRKTKSYLEKSGQKLAEIRSRRKYDEIANILMANLHAIPKGSKNTELMDFYTNEPISIKLNPEITVQKNAENLYRKAKNQQLEIDKLVESISSREMSLLEMEEKLESLQSADNLQFFRKEAKQQPAKHSTENLPYHSYEYQSWQILIGKNSKHNDTLTLKIANKNDLWLHAKDVPGSHVVIRHQAGKAFPKNIIERAAEIAAWNSKRKTDSLCPVIVTPKKYVRKRKGDPPGAVVVEKEEVVLVKPINI